MVCGLLKPTAGYIEIGGFNFAQDPDKVKRCIGYVPDFFGVYDNVKVKEYMEFYGSIYGIDDADIHRMTGDLLELGRGCAESGCEGGAKSRTRFGAGPSGRRL